jgi:hypothetical protein
VPIISLFHLKRKSACKCQRGSGTRSFLEGPPWGGLEIRKDTLGKIAAVLPARSDISALRLSSKIQRIYAIITDINELAAMPCCGSSPIEGILNNGT